MNTFFVISMWDGQAVCMMHMFFANSSLFEAATAKRILRGDNRIILGCNIPPLLVADSAYPLLPWILKPYTNNVCWHQSKIILTIVFLVQGLYECLWKVKGQIAYTDKTERHGCCHCTRCCSNLLHIAQSLLYLWRIWWCLVMRKQTTVIKIASAYYCTYYCTSSWRRDGPAQN